MISNTRARTRSVVRASINHWLAPSVLAIFVFAGFFKASPMLAWLPFDLTLAGAVLVFVSSAYLLASNPQRVRVSPWLLFVGTVVVIAFVPLPGNAFASSARLGICLVILAAVAARILVNDDANKRRAFVWLSVFAGSALCALAQFDADLSTGRVAAAGSNSIATAQAGGLVVVGLSSLMVCGSLRSARLRLLALGGIAAGFVTMLQTGSRGPLLAAVVAVVVVALVGGHIHHRALRALAVAGAAWAGYFLLMSSASPGAQRLQAALSDGSENTATRWPLWELAADSILDNPLGLGWGNFYQAGPSLLTGDRIYPHNIVLEVAAEGGWLAGFLMLVLLAMALIRLARAARDATEGALLGLTILSGGTAMVSGNLADHRMLFVLVVLGLVGQQHPRAERASVK